MYGAAPLKQTSRDFFCSIDMPLFNIFGMSETTGATTMHRGNRFSLDSCGAAMQGVDIKIDKPNPDANGEGEMCIRGRSTMLGYLKNEKACISTFDHEGYVHSGDLGTLDKEGWLRITGRIKEIIITAGG